MSVPKQTNIIFKTTALLKKQFQKKCIDNDVTMREVLTSYIIDFITRKPHTPSATPSDKPIEEPVAGDTL